MAQWITRLTTDQKIPGSNPGRLEESILFWKEHIHEFGLFVKMVYWGSESNFSIAAVTAEQKDLVHCYIESYQKNILLPGGESNPGLPRDRRGYLPLYYRGVVLHLEL